MTAFDAVSFDSHQSQPLADLITSTSHTLFDTLPRHGKPTIRANGRHEWTILATISLVTHTYVELAPGIELVESTRILPISLGTGVKVLPATKLPPAGDTLHDSHAEILARRGLVRWLLEEAGRVIKGTETEDLLEWVGGKFRLKEGVETWLYISALPCGDASTLHTAIYQDAEMAAIKALEQVPQSAPGSAVRGRNGYENYGAIRTKPGRADSPPTISFSCSDKIATWSVLGLQGAILESLFDPVYLTGVVIGGVNEYGPLGGDLRHKVRPEIARAIWGRLGSLERRIPKPFRLSRPEVIFTSLPFSYSKPVISLLGEGDPSTSTVCISHVPLCSPLPEVIVNGGKQGGVWKAPGLTPLGWKARSKLCKLELMTSFIHLQESLSLANPLDYAMPTREATYYDLKHHFESPYRYVKELLRGHLRSPSILSHFEKCGELHTTGCLHDEVGVMPPFQGWIVSGEKWESFTVDGRVHMDPELFVIPKIEPEPESRIDRSADIDMGIVTPVHVETVAGTDSPDSILVTPPFVPPPVRYSDVVLAGKHISFDGAGNDSGSPRDPSLQVS